MRFSSRWTAACLCAASFVFSTACSSGHEGCRPNPSVTPDMAGLGLPPPEGGKLCHAEAGFLMYELQKDRMDVVKEFTGKLESSGWKETTNPSGGTASGELYYQKNAKTVMFSVTPCSQSFPGGLVGSCTVLTFDDVTKK